LPGTDVLPPGPLRDFVEALHELYGEAGAPGTRRISQDSRDRDDLPDTNSHEGVSGILRGAGVPRWSKVECLVRVLAARAVGRPDVDATVQRFHRLWSSTAGIGSATVLTAQVEPSSTAELITTLENPHAFELEEELRRRAEAGDEAAARSLTVMLTQRADGGDWSASDALAQLFGRSGRCGRSSTEGRRRLRVHR
jgi:hypothetical protein